MGLGDVTGSLEPGKSADFVIVDRDFVAGPADAIIDTRVLETWFAGRQVFTAG
jgi:predicted amidohydrolase YtcJ